MDPATIGLLLNAGGLIARNMMGSGRPKYDIPQSSRQALARAKVLADDPSSPSESRNLDLIGISTANAVRAAQEGGNALEVIPTIQAEQNRATQQVFAQSAEQNRVDEQDLIRNLAMMAEKEDLAYQMNEFAPYAEQQQETRDIFGAMAENLGAKAEREDFLAKLAAMGYGGGGSPGAPPATDVVQTIMPESYDDKIGPYESTVKKKRGSNFGNPMSDFAESDIMRLLPMLMNLKLNP